MNCEQAVVDVRVRPGARLPSGVDIEKAEKRAVQLHQDNSGLNAEIILNDGKNPDSPLHGLFEWSDTKAAYEYRLEQARHFLRSIVVTISEPDGTESPARRFVFDSETVLRHYEEGPGSYIAIEQVLSDEQMCKRQAEMAIKELRQWVDRWSFVRSYLEPIHSAVADAVKQK